MHASSTLLSGLSLLPFAALTAASQVGYFDSTDCADPSGFETCYEDADSWLADCINENCEGLGVDCHNACEHARQSSYTECAVGHCWNKVYSCEYQLQVSDSVSTAVNPENESVPFFPPPDDAEGRCSCNIGHIVEAQNQVNVVIAQCGDLVDPFSQTTEQIESIGQGCLCCGVSGMLSTLAATCPDLDPAELQLDDVETLLGEFLGTINWDECQQWLNQYDCVGDYGYPAAIDTYYGPGNIPEGGTETLYNIGALTTPVSATVTFTVGGELFPVTAVSTDADVPTGTGTGSSGSGSGSDSSSDSGNSDEGSSDSSSDTNDNAGNGNGDESGSSTESGSDDQATGSGDTPEDVAAQVSISSTLVLFVAATLGVAYML